MLTIKIGRRGQITIPHRIRQQVGLREGDSLAMIPQEGQVILRPITQTLLDLRGSVVVSGEQDFNAIRQQVFSDQLRKGAPNGE